MKTLPMREFLRSAKARQSVHDGREYVLTVNGKPFVKVSPPEQVRHHLGAGKKFSTGRAVRHDSIPASEWKGMM